MIESNVKKQTCLNKLLRINNPFFLILFVLLFILSLSNCSLHRKGYTVKQLGGKTKNKYHKKTASAKN
jgi:hypothetical protein